MLISLSSSFTAALPGKRPRLSKYVPPDTAARRSASRTATHFSPVPPLSSGGLRTLVGCLRAFIFLHPYCLTKKVRILSIFVFKYLFFIIKSSKNNVLSRQKIVGTAWKWKYIAERCLISSFCAKSSLNPAYFVGETKKPADSFKIAVRRF